MTALDVKGTFNVAWWPSILKSLKDAECPRNLYYLSQGYFSQRTAALTTNGISIERRVTKGCQQRSCCGPGFWNLLCYFLRTHHRRIRWLTTTCVPAIREGKSPVAALEVCICSTPIRIPSVRCLPRWHKSRARLK